MTRDFAFITAVGVAHQSPTDKVFVPVKLPDPTDEAKRQSFQYSEAGELRLPLRMRARVTAYYTFLRAMEFSEQERAFGLEFFLRRELTERLSGFLSYTLSRTLMTYTGQTERAFGDRTHLLSMVLGYDLGNHWRIGTRFFFESGRPYCLPGECVAGPGYGPSTVVGNLPPFYRIDARLEKRWLFPSGKWLAATLECFNVLDKSEATDMPYTSATGFVPYYETPTILPSVGVEGASKERASAMAPAVLTVARGTTPRRAYRCCKE